MSWSNFSVLARLLQCADFFSMYRYWAIVSCFPSSLCGPPAEPQQQGESGTGDGLGIDSVEKGPVVDGLGR